MRTLVGFLGAAVLLCAQAPKPVPPPHQLTGDEKAEIIGGITELGKRISLIRAQQHDAALLADVEIYHKALAWMLRYPEEVYNRNYVGFARVVIAKGLDRARSLEKGQAPWTTRKGHVPRAYRSRVDGGLQPYAVVIPAAYDGRTPMRLDLVLHGRNATLSEVSFLAGHEQPRTPDLYTDRIELHVFGRTNNAYRWSGETDVFEALEAVKHHYRIDPDRVVLRGFSMGGAGAWHIGLHYPSDWAGIEAGAGFTETIEYAKQINLAPHVRAMLRIYDAMDYARNLFNVPTVGYGGELDAQLRASVNIQEQLKREGVNWAPWRALFLVGPQMGHRFHPDSRVESEVFLESHLPRKEQDEIQFVTYTTRYNRSGWVTVEGLEKHYERTEVMASRSTEGVVATTKNVALLRLDGSPKRVRLDGQEVSSPSGVYVRRQGRWEADKGGQNGLRKVRGLQGPIDDAFMESFVVVKPAGAESKRLTRFREEYAKYLRADVREVTDSELTPDQIRDSNLVLFGEPWSNRVMGRVMKDLPVRWDRKTIKVGGQTFDARTHTLVMIYPNPLNRKRYVVLNTGHTFGEKEFKGTNALLYARIGDWGVVDERGGVVASGLMGEDWNFH